MYFGMYFQFPIQVNRGTERGEIYHVMNVSSVKQQKTAILNLVEMLFKISGYKIVQ